MKQTRPEQRDPRHWLDAQLRCSGFAARYPGYLHVLSRLDALDDPRVSVMAVSAARDRFRLHLNRPFFEAHPEYLNGVLLHEIHHVVLGHVTDHSLRGSVFRDLMELAMEISANEFICEPLPGTPCVWQNFAALGVAPCQSTRQRYELLAEARRGGKLPRALAVALDDHGFLADVDGESPDADDVAALLAKLLREVELAAMAAGEAPPVLAGRTPRELVRIEMLSHPGVMRAVDWRHELDFFVRRLRAPRLSFSRPNRRFAGRIGIVPGRVRAAAQGRRTRILVVIDTSSSIDAATLAEIAGQSARIAGFAAVTVVECDTAIRRAYAFAGAILEVVGRGGTDLRPPFGADFLARHRPDGVVYFTDGQGPYPSQPPSVPTLWALTGGYPFDCPWGRRVKVGD